MVGRSFDNALRRCAVDRLPGGGVGQLAGIVFDVDRLAFGAEQQLPILQSANDGFGSRIAAGGNLVDTGNGLAEIVGGEMGKCVFEACSARDRAAQREAEDQ